jgi:hypothetical protein
MAALGGAHRAPRTFEGTARGSDGAIDIDLVALRDCRDGLFGGRIQGFESAP